jgi:exosortase
MSKLGVTLLRSGNMIQMPGMTIEVADVCSGTHKLLSIAAFAAIFGALYNMGLSKRVMLILLSLPIALIVNVIRISIIILFASTGGLTAMEAAHDPAEYVSIILAFLVILLIGNVFGCKIQKRLF